MPLSSSSSTSLVARARIASRDVLRRIGFAAVKKRSKLPPSPFETWDYRDADDALGKALLRQTIDTSGNTQQAKLMPAAGEGSFPNPRQWQDPIAINRAFYQGNHWQDSAGYIGPHPAINDPGRDAAWSEIALGFTSKNVVKEVDDRHSLGVAGRPVGWSFVLRRNLDEGEEPNPTEQTLIKEATALMRPWLSARKLQSVLREAIVTLLNSERSALLLRIPAGLTDINADGKSVVVAASIEDALSKIFVEHPMPEHATVVCDDDTKLECGVWLFSGDDESTSRTQDFAGLTFLDENAQTVIRIMPQRAESLPVDSTLDLGGRIVMFEMHRAVLITTSVQQQQRALNLAETMIPRNVVTGGFLERVLLDAQLPGRPEIDANGKKTGKWIREPFYTGAGTTNVIVGAEYENDDGTVTRGKPDIKYREPIAPTASITASDKHYRNILDETSQLHVLLGHDGNASGKSRIEARAEYVKSLLLTQPEAQNAWAFVVETALAMAEQLARSPGKYTKFLRVEAVCRLDAGPLTPDEIKAIEGSIGVTISQETAMAQRGVFDTEAEKAKMAADPLARAKLGKAVGDALYALTQAGATLPGAAAIIGIEGDLLDKLLTPETFDRLPPAPVPTTTTTNGPPKGGDRVPSDNVPPDNPKRTPAQPSTSSSNNNTNGKGNGKSTQTTRQTSNSGSAAGGAGGGA